LKKSGGDTTKPFTGRSVPDPKKGREELREKRGFRKRKEWIKGKGWAEERDRICPLTKS